MICDQGICAFFHRPAAFVLLASYFIDSEYNTQLLWLRFCHALFRCDPLATLLLFTATQDQIIDERDLAWMAGEISIEEEDPENLDEQVPRWDILNEDYLLNWLSDYIDHEGESSAYCLDIIWMIILASTAEPA
jgi:hypothetical protein